MKWYPLSLVVLVALGAVAEAQTDRVRTLSGTLSGQVTGITPLEVTLQRNNREEKIPVNEVRGIQFGEEPSELTQARVNASNGGYDKALALLTKINPASLRDENVKQEVSYYTAYSNVRRALLGAMDLAEAGGQLNAFVNSNRSSFHQWEAQELLGDLLLAMGNYPAAEKKYELLARAPWPSYQMRSAVLSGRALQAQGKHAEAIERFTAAEKLADESAVGKSQLLAAKLGRAVSLAATGKVDQGVELARAVIADAAPEDRDLQARAYNALGDCYQKAGRKQEALFAYLHVDLLYSSEPEAHAEALHHLAALWEATGKPNEARDARQKLKTRYPTTSWAKQ
jgi:tetratricopeptide (TPR) repeat protein